MIQIDELRMSVPGNDEIEGAELGRQVAERIAIAIPENYGNFLIPEIRLQLQSSGSNDVSMMADRIAEQVIKEIKRTSL